MRPEPISIEGNLLKMKPNENSTRINVPQKKHNCLEKPFTLLMNIYPKTINGSICMLCCNAKGRIIEPLGMKVFITNKPHKANIIENIAPI